MVTINVGKEGRPFPTHKELVIYQSKYFRAALEADFKEADHRTVTLEDVDEDIFRLFFNWLYK